MFFVLFLGENMKSVVRNSLFLLSSFPCLAFALYNGSPALPEMPRENFFLQEDSIFSLKLDYQGDFVLGRRVTANSSFQNSSISSRLNGAELSLGFSDRVELYSLLGVSKTSFSSNYLDQTLHLSTKESFGGLIGVRAIGAFWGDIKLGFDAKYFYGWPRIDSLRLGEDHLSGSCSQSVERQWQLGAGFSQTFAYFTPYVGVKYSKFFLDFIGVQSLDKEIAIQNVSPFGVFIGLGISGKKGPFLDLEASFLDEYAFSAALGFRF